MKKVFVFVFVLLAIIFFAGPAQASRLFDTYLHDGVYNFNDVFKLTRSDVFTTYKSQFGLTTYDVMVKGDDIFIREDPTDMFNFGITACTYKQFYKGVEVEQKNFNVSSKCEVVLSITGKVVEDLSIDTTGHITDTTALDSALHFINAPLGYTWQNANYELGLKRNSVKYDSTGEYDSTKTSYPKGQLIISKRYGPSYSDVAANYALCWKFPIAYLDTVIVDSVLRDSVEIYNVQDTIIKHRIVYVNASTGAIWGSYDPANGDFYESGKVWHLIYGDQYTIEDRTCTVCSNHYLEDHWNIHTYWQGIGIGNANNTIVHGSNNQWDGGSAYERESASVHWSVERAANYFETQQGTQSYNNRTNIIIDRDNVIGALWGADQSDDSQDDIYTGNPGQYGQSTSSAMDVMAHEFTHKINYRARKVGQGSWYWGESAVINESFSDIFGLLAESWVTGSCDWQVGNQLYGGVIKRRFSDPEHDYYPNTPSGSGSCINYTTMTDFNNAPPYSGGGIIRKWFNHLALGSTSWTNPLAGVGLNTAGRIAFLTLTTGLTGGSNINDLRAATLDIADKNFGGKCGDVWKAVEKSWVDVGVGTQSSCNGLRGIGPWVVASEWIATSSAHPVVFTAATSACESGSFTGLTYEWNIPEGWSGTTSDDGSTFTLTGIIDDHSSKVISVDVSYYDCDGNPVTETVSNVLHICDECNDNPDMGRHANNNGQSQTVALTSDKIKIRPNPASKQVYITLPNEVDNADGILQDMSGKTVQKLKLKKGENVMLVSGLPSGVYILKISNNATNFTKKVIVQ